MTKAKEQVVNVKVNPAERNGTNRDEVAIQSVSHDDDPYINKVVYAKPGTFKDGESVSMGEVERLEAKSKKALDDELATALERETKEREAAQKLATQKETVSPKKEG